MPLLQLPPTDGHTTRPQAMLENHDPYSQKLLPLSPSHLDRPSRGRPPPQTARTHGIVTHALSDATNTKCARCTVVQFSSLAPTAIQLSAMPHRLRLNRPPGGLEMWFISQPGRDRSSAFAHIAGERNWRLLSAPLMISAVPIDQRPPVMRYDGGPCRLP